MKNINFNSLESLSKEARRRVFEWWSEKICHEKHTCSDTPSELDKKLLKGFFVQSNEGELIAAAGMVYARNQKKELIHHDGRLVVELGSNYVNPEYRGNGIASKLLKLRIEAGRKEDWYMVGITTNPAMLKAFEKIGGKPMDDDLDLKLLREDLCLCTVRDDSCLICPLARHGAWTFE